MLGISLGIYTPLFQADILAILFCVHTIQTIGKSEQIHWYLL
jgi:hypothetical protein